MKILQINCVYGEGSTGKITRDIHEGLMVRGHESIVIYGRRGKSKEKHVYKVCSEAYAKANNLRSRFDGMMYGGCLMSTEAIKRKIKKERPDIVHLQCINGYFCNIFKLLNYLKKTGIPTVLTLHAEFMYTANCGHAGECNQWMEGCQKCPKLHQETKSVFFDRTGKSWKKMHQIYKDWNKLSVVCCSNWIYSRASKSGEIKNRNMCVINNGIDNKTLFYPRKDAKERVKMEYCIDPNKKIILFVAPEFSHLKGFDLLLKLAEVCEDTSFQFVVVGDDWKVDCSNLTVVGRVSDQIYLAELYSAADALVICSRNENYPTVCVEATSCGTPVVGFDVGGVKETIPQGMGDVVPLGDVHTLKERLIEVTDKELDDDTVYTARRYHSKERMIDEYVDLYKLLLDERLV